MSPFSDPPWPVERPKSVLSDKLEVFGRRPTRDIYTFAVSPNLGQDDAREYQRREHLAPRAIRSACRSFRALRTVQLAPPGSSAWRTLFATDSPIRRILPCGARWADSPRANTRDSRS